MSVRDIGKVCLFSKISGVIMLDGAPVANARVTRIADAAFVGGKKVDETQTDAKGYFEMPAVFERTVSKYLPQEFAIGQQILVSYQGKEYEMWAGVKRKEEENAESKGKPLEVTCELNGEKNDITVNGGPFITLCQWDVEPDEVIPIDELPGPGEG